MHWWINDLRNEGGNFQVFKGLRGEGEKVMAQYGDEEGRNAMVSMV
jgi:hypothetical protein